MSRNIIETVLGALVLVGAAIFLVFSYSSGDIAEVDGYSVSADFSNIGGLQIGDPVQISGVKVGQIKNISLSPESYLAHVTMEIGDDIQITDDATAQISSQSLLGGKYMDIQPGSSEIFLENNGQIEYTQAPQNLEDLLGKFIFSATSKGGNPPPPPEPATTPADLPADKTDNPAETSPSETLAPDEPYAP
ncbi:MAG: outer membrane lipid asymmetry maintenance protein MlaD [Pseudobdellovibrionaceae bacterium]